MTDNKTKGLLGVIGAVLITLLIIFALFKSVAAEKHLRIQKEKELSSKVSELIQKEADLAEMMKQKTAFETQAKAAQANLESVMKQTEEKLKALSGNVELLTQDNETLTKERDLSLKKIGDLNKHIQELEADKYDLVTKIKALQSSTPVVAVTPSVSAASTKSSSSQTAAEEEAVPLGKIVVQKSTGKPATVQQIDNVYGFVIVNAGSLDGLKQDSILNIARNNELIAKAVVEKVKDNVAAALILPEWSKGEVKVGDTVTKI